MNGRKNSGCPSTNKKYPLNLRKKEPMLRYSIFSFVLLGIIAFTSSCISQKKYAELEAQKLRSDRRAEELAKEAEKRRVEADSLRRTAEGFRTEYNEMKNMLIGSNAQKNAYIDSLNSLAGNLANDKSTISRDLEEVKEEYEYEKKRLEKLTAELEERQRELESLRKSIPMQEIPKKQE